MKTITPDSFNIPINNSRNAVKLKVRTIKDLQKAVTEANCKIRVVLGLLKEMNNMIPLMGIWVRPSLTPLMIHPSTHLR
jgi:hypothetical protein